MPRYLSSNTDAYKIIAESYMHIQKVRVATGSKTKTELKNTNDKLSNMIERIKKNKYEFKKMISSMLEEEPIWLEFLKHINGIGEIVSMKLLSFPLDLEKDITSWWAYAGLVPHVYKCQCEKGHKILSAKESTACNYQDYESKGKCNAKVVSCQVAQSKKHKGYKLFWNTKLKALSFVITESFIKQGKYYRKCFEFYKNRALKKGLQKAHAHMHARRLTFKIFLSHLHQAGCEIFNVPYRKPYQFDILNHKSFISWKEVVDIEDKI